MSHLLKFQWSSVGYRLFFLFFVGMSFCIAAMGYYFYGKSAEIIESKVGKIALQTTQQAGKRLDVILDEYENRSFIISGSKDLQKSILDDFADPYERQETNKRIGEFLGNMMNSKNDIDGLYIFGLDGHSYKYAEGYATISPLADSLRRQDWFRSIVAANGRVVWLGIRPTPVPAPWADQRLQHPVFCFGRAIQDMDNLNRIIGVMLVEIKPGDILAQIDFGEMGTSLIVDRNDRIVGTPNEADILKPAGLHLPEAPPSAIDRRAVNGQNTVIVYDRLANGWQLVGLVPAKELVKDTREIGMFMLSLAAGFMLAAIGYAWIAAWQMKKPVNLLLHSMRKAQEGDFEVQIRAGRKDEFGILFQGFNAMVSRIKSLIDELYVQKLLQKELQLKMFATQINAHFLYNTLDSIHWISRIYKVDEISTMIFGLSNYFRLSLSEGKDVVSIGEVIELLNSYLSIQKVRYQDRLEASIVADDGLLREKVLKFAFQPLVENAIYHGIENKKGVGRLDIRWSRKGEALLFEVTDDGVGIPPDKLQEIRSMLQGGDARHEGNFALKNIHSLIRLIYGQEYGLHIESRPASGTRVVLTLPLSDANLSAQTPV